MFSLVEMLRYMRPDGCEAQRLFCQRFLEPVFGYPDVHGNYIKIISDETGQYPSIPCLLYTSPSPRDGLLSRMPSSA